MDGHTCKRAKSVIDGLPVRCVGEWAFDKIFHLYQYFGILTHGMKKRWRGINYIEICAGPGRCIFKETGEEVDGTALAILNHSKFPFVDSALFIDNDPETLEVLNRRINILEHSSKARGEIGDYNDSDGIVGLLSTLPTGHLNLVFIDPTDCGVPFQTIERIICTLENVDLIITVAVGMDAGRNLVNAVLKREYGEAREKYSAFLGAPVFFESEEVRQMAQSGDSRSLRSAFRLAFRDRLRACGYEYSTEKPIRHYYDLVFASRKPKGIEFWNKVCRIEPDGQRKLL